MIARHFLVPAYLVLCIILGGGSLSGPAAETFGFVGNVSLQLLALPIMIWALMREQSGQPTPAHTLVLLAAALVAMMLIQLVPLPPAIWTSLPGRERIAAGFEMLGQPLPWLPLSLSPAGSVAGLLWLLPAVAALLGVVRLGAYRSTFLAWTLVGITMVSVLVAGLQVTGGRSFYLYIITNFGQGVGFFANSNHQATLLFCTIPFVAALYADQGRKRSRRGTSGLVVVLLGVAVVLAVGLALNRSLAGAGLGLASAAASLLLILYRSRPLPVWAPAAAAAALAGAIALIYVGPTSGALMQEVNTSSSSRATMVGTTAVAAGDFFPVGSGVGTFADVYHWYEDPAAVNTMWVNHAHGDVVEILLETGLLGALLMIAFLIWWGRRAYAVWRDRDRPDQFARAAVIASAAVVAHSFVDYPLRTAAISVLFAICLALMAQPRPSAKARSSRDQDEDAVRHLSA